MDNPASACEECLKILANYHCIECEQSLCLQCDKMIHSGGKRKSHRRLSLCNLCRSQATHYCSTCTQHFCQNCLYFHSFHKVSLTVHPVYNAVFWDLNSYQTATGEEIKQTLLNLKNLYAEIDIFKVYGDSYFKWQEFFSSSSAEFSQPEGLKESEAILIDISLINKNQISEVLLLSLKASQYKTHLNQIQSAIPKLKLYVSLSLPSVKKIPVDQLADKKNTAYKPSVSKFLPNDSRGQEKQPKTQIPVYQSFARKKGQNLYHDHLVTFLKELSDSGQILHDSSWLCKAFSHRSRVSISQSTEIIRELEALGHIHTAERVFSDIKTVFFTGLKIENLSCESLLWTLRSLKIDEMLPSDRSVQSRIREAFDYKISQSEWTVFLETLKNMPKNHGRSSSEQIFNYSLFSSNFVAGSPEFIVRETLDSVTKQKVSVIYPKGEEWQSVDQFIKEGDVLGIKETQDWHAFNQFFIEYFSVSDPESRAIPGGRYGCAQFLKYCGCSVLRHCSLGKLSYMVQLSIDEDLMRYCKTLLIWTEASGRTEGNKAKLEVVKNKVIEVLKEYKEGVSLAQLPLYLKKKIPFPLNVTELGFAKLKDLLLTLPGIEVESRGNNHPFAVYRNMQLSELKQTVEECVGDGIFLSEIEAEINSKFGKVDWGVFESYSLLDFIDKNTDLLVDSQKVVYKASENKGNAYSQNRTKQNTHKITYSENFKNSHLWIKYK